jgi:hypothetical protein
VRSAEVNANPSVDVVAPASSGGMSPKGESVEIVGPEGEGNASGGRAVVSGGSDSAARSGGVEAGKRPVGSGSVERTTSVSDDGFPRR